MEWAALRVQGKEKEVAPHPGRSRKWCWRGSSLRPRFRNCLETELEIVEKWWDPPNSAQTPSSSFRVNLTLSYSPAQPQTPSEDPWLLIIRTSLFQEQWFSSKDTISRSTTSLLHLRLSTKPHRLENITDANLIAAPSPVPAGTRGPCLLKTGKEAEKGGRDCGRLEYGNRKEV